MAKKNSQTSKKKTDPNKSDKKSKTAAPLDKIRNSEPKKSAIRKTGPTAKTVHAEVVEDESIDQAQATPEVDIYDELAKHPEDHLDEELDIELKEPSSEKTTRAQKSESSGSRAVATADPVLAYLAEVRKYPLLTREQESEIAKKFYETKDPQYAQALVTANLRFVVKVAMEYSRFGARLIDLIQEGNMGLMHAVKDFNPYKGVRLITYAVWWIRGYIQEYLMKQYSMVKIGTTQNQKKLFYQLQKQKEALETMGDSENIKLLSTRLNIPEDEVKMMAQRMSGRDVSLNQKIDDDSPGSLLDFQKSGGQTPDEELAHLEEIENLKEAIEAIRPQLSAKEKIILEERLLNDEPLTLQEIGDKYGITREAVRQTEVRVIKKIKDHFATRG